MRFTRKYETGTESTREHVAKARAKFKPVKFEATADGRFEREESNSETSDRSNELFATFEPIQRRPEETQERVLAFRKTIKWLDPKASETSVISNIANLMHTTTLTTFTENISLMETSKRTMDTKAAFNMVLKFLRPVEAALEASYNGDAQETATSRVSGTLSVARNLSAKEGA